MTHSLIAIPGIFTADYDPATEKIVAWHFTPDASYAGYFGPAAVHLDGADPGDLQDDNQPFWRAVYTALGPDRGHIEGVQWTTDGPDITPFTEDDE